MNDLAVRIVHLDPMRVATAYGFGENPEELAWETFMAWARPRGLLDDLDSRPVFGINNPYPAPNHKKYGYEFWVKVGPEVEPEGGIRIEEFFGGSYAVTRCEVKGNPDRIAETWRTLAAWCESNNHQLGRHPALERFLSTPGDLELLVLELYCPIGG